ncbi:WhiB family transcriptional regulator [Streptomyces sp. NPDC003863]
MCGTGCLLPRRLPRQPRREEAKALCGTCPVLRECRAWALDNPGLASRGIWGGLTPHQRRTYRRPSVSGSERT